MYLPSPKNPQRKRRRDLLAAQQRPLTSEQKRQEPVAALKLPVRTVNQLEEEGIIFIEQLLAQSYERLLAIRNFGAKTVEDIARAVRAFGLPTPPDWA